MRTFLLILFILSSQYAVAQKQDYNWLTGIANPEISDIKAQVIS